MKRIFGIFIFAIAMLISACSTDLDVTGQWKETMVVYGLLDQGQAKQYIKINKAFLGQGNAFTFAQVKDSVQFVNALQVTLHRIKNGIPVGNDIVLLPDNTIPKDPGTFYGPDQANAIYSFTHTTANDSLYADSEYKLIIKNTDTGKEVTAQTIVIGDFGAYSSPSVAASQFSFVQAGNDNYRFSLKFNSAPNVRIYQVLLRFHFVDSTASGNVADSVDWQLTEKRTSTLNGGEGLDYGFRGQDFLEHVGNLMASKSTVGLLARIPGKLDIIAIAAADQLATFIDVNAPSTGIIQEKPEYTNINGGLGILSSRYYKAPFSKPLGPETGSSAGLGSPTLDSLSGGRYTCTFKFLNNIRGTGVWTGCH